ncbi:uncharacterized protein FOMMEDRAFT_140811 [Fomitiporia mediterranea MF3/22]|uniref:uncharacterized protein n=1 Tax=Fomitiporia mediterranea (strain MF3/22) TaxID=694068 RepID=UPI0004408C99|nr:uncharacterized protein FOMMEDRAFT_140811 [Fomitiporia mediterranea MF3/22]EJD03052.1 hypothetical protein FOMMEDRAFT_140811 [Fomitiporia mediterranea MF3/22]
MLGTPLSIFIEKDVAERDQLVEIITKHGGTVSPGYSGVPYILVDPHTESGQSLYRQYAGKKGKIVLSYQWIHECIRANELQTYHTGWAGCRVTGSEQVRPRAARSNANGAPTDQSAGSQQRLVHSQTHVQPIQPPIQTQVQLPQQQHHAAHPSSQHQLQHQVQPPTAQPQAQPHPASHPGGYAHHELPPAQPQMLTPATPLGPPGFGYPVYAGQGAQHHASRASLTQPGAPQNWQTPTPITPHQHTTHIQMLPPRAQNPYARDDHWSEAGPAFAQLTETHLPPMNDPQTAAYYDQRYRDGQNAWTDAGHDYYDQSQSYDATYQPEQYVPITGPSTSSTTLEQTTAPPPPAPASAPASQEPIPAPGPAQDQEPAQPPSPREETRGRRRTRAQPQTNAPASSLVLTRRHPPARSPTPPTRVIKSTYGGNLFTADDIEYLKKYIDYCQEQGLVLSLREICERIAVKAPHHTFYSWRRYCNKHQIRLGGYAMDIDSRSPSPSHAQENGQSQVTGTVEDVNVPAPTGEGPFTIEAANRMYQEHGMRNRSPTPPRALYRSTTGKGVAFTSEDVAFLCKFMAYRKLQGRLDMVTFWKDVSSKAPHHSRASWMKYYRRHKHELNRVEGDEPLPAPPTKKMRYGRNDDILLAQYFVNKPEGTSDKIFQEFAKIYTHHPWKGWQEHHRIHKAKIDHLILRLQNGEMLEPGEESD